MERLWSKTRIDRRETASGTEVTILPTFKRKEALDHVVGKYSAIEGSKRHLDKLEAYLGQILT
jgi:hypothetical protein